MAVNPLRTHFLPGWAGFKPDSVRPLVDTKPHATALRLRPPENGNGSNLDAVASKTGKKMYISTAAAGHRSFERTAYVPVGRHEANPTRSRAGASKENSRPSSASLWRSVSSADYDVSSRPASRPPTSMSSLSNRARPASALESNRGPALLPHSVVHLGTIKGSAHVPGYCGHVPASTSAGVLKTRASSRDGAALADNFLLNCPGYAGFVPQDAQNKPHTKRMEHLTTYTDTHRNLPSAHARPTISGDTRERGPKSPLPGPAIQMHALRMSEKGRLTHAVRSTCDF